MTDWNDFHREQQALHLVHVDALNGCLYLTGLRPSGQLSRLEAEAVIDELQRGIALLKRAPQPVATPEHFDERSTQFQGGNV